LEGKRNGGNTLFQGKLAEINVVFVGGDEVNELAHLSPEIRLVEDLEEFA
jgi:hypothetical protein